MNKLNTIDDNGASLPEQLTFDALRQDLPLTQATAYFQTGSHGPTPDSVLRVVCDAMQFQSHQGAASTDATASLYAREEQVRQQLAALLNVQAAELAWTPNTSQAMLRILHSIAWQPGDEFVVSSAEHVSLVGACQALAHSRGVVIKWFPADQGDAVLLEALSAALTPRSRLICLSEVSTWDGRRLPVREACALAHQVGVPVMVDGAQSVGQYAVDVAALGCDYYFAAGHKWLLGPLGVGFLWVARERLPTFRPDFIPDVHPWTRLTGSQPPITAASRVELGTHNPALVIGLGRALEIISALGLAAIEAHTTRLARLLFDEIATWPDTHWLTPTEPGHATGLLTLVLDGYDEPHLRTLVTHLQEEHLIVKFQPVVNALRISLAAFNTETEVWRLLETLKRLRSRPARR